MLCAFYARLLVFDKSSAQPDFAVVNYSWRSDDCVLLPCFNAQPDIFVLQLRTAVS